VPSSHVIFNVTKLRPGLVTTTRALTIFGMASPDRATPLRRSGVQIHV
jgi:hypothetical protein